MTSTAARSTSQGTPLGASLRRALDGRWRSVREEARATLPAELMVPDPTLSLAEQRARTTRLLHQVAETGHPRMGYPVELGGTDDLGGTITAFEMLGHGDLSLLVKAGVQWGLFGGAVLNLGTASHHEALLPAILSGDLLGCFAMTETGHGSDVQSLGTTATFDSGAGEFVVHTPDDASRKDYIGGAAVDGRLAVVFVQLVTGGASRGVHAVLVPIRDDQGRPMPGVRIEDCGPKGGLDGVDNGRLSFDHVRIPRSALLDRYGQVDEDGTYRSPIANPSRRFFTMLGTLVRGRISVAGGAGAATRTGLAIAVRYALVRRQFFVPGSTREVVLLDYLAHQRRLLPALATSYALQFAQNELVSAMHDLQSATRSGPDDDQQAQRELESRAAGLKAIATWHATRTIQECREACGGAGYLAENRLTTLKADSDVFTTFEGDNTVLLQLVAKGLLTSYADEFGDLDTLGMVRFAARQFAGVVLERTAARALVQQLIDAAPGRQEDDDLLDRGVQLRMFEDRERHVLEGLARRLRGAGENGFEVFNAAQDHVLRAARVHVDRVVLEAFVAGISGCQDPAAASVLGRMCDLYVLSNIEADRAWFLEHGRLTAARAKAVTATVNSLCSQLRPLAGDLVEGFGIPDAWLGAAILREELARQQAPAYPGG